MNKLVDYFGKSVERLGAFYPTHCLVALFRTAADAEVALHKLLSAGLAPSDAIAADGKTVLEFDKDEKDLARFIMQAISRFFATEQAFADRDLEDARHGAGFLAVRCPTDDLKNAAWRLIEPEVPLDARYYSRLGSEHLAGDFKTALKNERLVELCRTSPRVARSRVSAEEIHEVRRSVDVNIEE